MTKYCPNCGNKVADKDNVCSNCGYVLKDTQDEFMVNPAPANPQQANAQGGQTNGLAIAGFVVSLVSIFCCGLILGIVGLVLSICGYNKSKSLNGSGKGLATAGIIIGIICTILSIFNIIFAFSDMFNFLNMIDSLDI